MANWTNTLDTIEPETISETFTTDNTTTGLTGSKKRTFKKKLPYNIIPKKSIKRHLWLIPFINGIIIIFTSFVPFISTIPNGSVYPIWPFVNETGSVIPVAKYFSTFLDVIAALTIFVGIIIYKQIHYYAWELQQRFELDQPKDDKKINSLQSSRKIIMVTSILMSIGLVIIGNFRKIQNLNGHMIGVTIFLPSGIIYCFALVCIYLIIDSYGIQSSPTMIIVIMMINLSSTICCIVSAVLSTSEQHKSIWQYYKYDNELRLQWNSTMSGYSLHVLGDVCQWISLSTFGPLNIAIGRRFKMFQRWDCI